MSMLEDYFEATKRDVKAPSGITYKVRGLSVAEYGAALKGLPSLSPSKEKDKPNENTLDEVMQMQQDVCRAGTVEMSWGNAVAKGEALYGPEMWPAADVATVFMAIQQASGLVGEEADEARRSV